MLNTVWQENVFVKTRYMLQQRIKKTFSKLSQVQQNSLSFDIAWRISKYMVDKDKIEGLIATYNNVKVLKALRNKV